MIVFFNKEQKICRVMKEKGDKRYTHGYALPESGFLYDVLKHLKRLGHDAIKKRMWKDGHLVDDTQQYIRSRKVRPNGFYIYNSAYAIEDLGIEFNKLKAGEYLNLMVDCWE